MRFATFPPLALKTVGVAITSFLDFAIAASTPIHTCIHIAASTIVSARSTGTSTLIAHGVGERSRGRRCRQRGPAPPMLCAS